MVAINLLMSIGQQRLMEPIPIQGDFESRVIFSWTGCQLKAKVTSHFLLLLCAMSLTKNLVSLAI